MVLVEVEVLVLVGLEWSVEVERDDGGGDSVATYVSRAVWRPKPPGSSGAGTKVCVSSGEMASRRAERRPTLSAERYLAYPKKKKKRS